MSEHNLTKKLSKLTNNFIDNTTMHGVKSLKNSSHRRKNFESLTTDEEEEFRHPSSEKSPKSKAFRLSKESIALSTSYWNLLKQATFCQNEEADRHKFCQHDMPLLSTSVANFNYHQRVMNNESSLTLLRKGKHSKNDDPKMTSTQQSTTENSTHNFLTSTASLSPTLKIAQNKRDSEIMTELPRSSNGTKPRTLSEMDSDFHRFSKQLNPVEETMVKVPVHMLAALSASNLYPGIQPEFKSSRHKKGNFKKRTMKRNSSKLSHHFIQKNLHQKIFWTFVMLSAIYGILYMVMVRISSYRNSQSKPSFTDQIISFQEDGLVFPEISICNQGFSNEYLIFEQTHSLLDQVEETILNQKKFKEFLIKTLIFYEDAKRLTTLLYLNQQYLFSDKDLNQEYFVYQKFTQLSKLKGLGHFYLFEFHPDLDEHLAGKRLEKYPKIYKIFSQAVEHEIKKAELTLTELYTRVSNSKNGVFDQSFYDVEDPDKRIKVSFKVTIRPDLIEFLKRLNQHQVYYKYKYLSVVYQIQVTNLKILDVNLMIDLINNVYREKLLNQLDLTHADLKIKIDNMLRIYVNRNY